MDVSVVLLPDGRGLEVVDGGSRDGDPWLFHYGSPCGAVGWSVLDDAARRHGLRFIGYSRPGFGGSAPRPRTHPDGPRLVEDAADVELLLDRLGVGDFLTLGWSGGGPRAVACAAVLGGRCRAAAAIAGTAPSDGEGLDFTAGMNEDNVAEYAAAARGPEAYRTYLEVSYPGHDTITGQDLRASDDWLGEADRAAFTPDFADWVAATFRHGARQGLAGVLDDGIALLNPWGCDPAAITVPVVVWHGAADRMVPRTHGEWLAGHIPTAVPHLTEHDGHFSWLPHLDELLAELVALGR